MASSIDAVFSAYKVWPSTAPVGSGVNMSWGVDAVALEMATITHTADVDVAAYNYDDQSVTLSVEIESTFGSALFNNLWGAGSGGGSGGATNLAASRTSTNVTITSDTGTDATVAAASDTLAGVMTAAMKTKLDGIAAGAQVNPTTAAIVSAIDSYLGQTVWKNGSPMYDAQSLGVVADGTTDNRVTIANIIATVEAAGGGTIVLPVGIINVTAPTLPNNGIFALPSGVSVIGQGIGATTVRLVDPVNASVNGVFRHKDGTSPESISIRDFTIDCETPTGTAVVTAIRFGDAGDSVGYSRIDGILINGSDYGIVLENCFYVNVEGCRIEGAANEGISVSGASTDSIVIENNTINSSGTNGLFIDQGADVHVVDNAIVSSGEDAVHIGTGGALNGLTITGNLLSSSAINGIHVQLTTGFIVASNKVELSGEHGIRIDNANDGNIFGNAFYNNGTAADNTYSSIYFVGTSARNNVFGNTFIADSANRIKYTFEEASGPNDNHFFNNLTDGARTGPYLTTGALSTANRVAETWAALRGFKGLSIDPVSLVVTSNGTTVTASVEKTGTGDLRLLFSDGDYTFDATPAATVALTAGTTSSPTLNYIYILQSNKTLTKSTTGWPAAEHVALGTVLVQSAASVQTEGAYAVNVFESSALGASYNGKIEELTKWNRSQPARWVSGITVTPTITFSGGADDDIDLATTSGVVLKGRELAVSALDTAGSDFMYLTNSSAAAYTKVGTLATTLKTNASGGSIANNQYASIFVWLSVGETASTNKIMVNLPTGFYAIEKEAIADTKGYTVFTVPAALRTNAVPLARFVFKYDTSSGGTWTLISTYDLRGRTVDTLIDKSSAASPEFLDSEFKIRDESDPTKVAAFQLSGVATGTTRTITVPDGDGTMTLLDIAQAFAAGAKKTFSHSATTAGIKIAAVAGDPSSPEDGDVWYNASTNKFRKRQNGVTEDMDTQGSASPGGSDNQFTYNNGGAFGGSSGFTYNEADNRPVVVNGLELDEASTPSAPSANKAVLFMRDRGSNKAFPTLIDQYGDIYTLGASSLQSKTFGILKARANSGTPADLFHGVTAINNGSAIDVTTGTYGKRHKMAYTSVAATLNSSAGFRSGIRSFYREGGFYWRCRWSPSTGHDTLSGQTRGFWGVANSTAALSGATDFSSQVNIIGVGWDATQTTLRVGSNDGSGAATVTDLGANFPVNTVDTEVYDIALFCDPADTSQVYYFIERLNTGHTASGSLTSNLPAATTALGAQGWSSQGNQSATAVTVHFYYSYWELPY